MINTGHSKSEQEHIRISSDNRIIKISCVLLVLSAVLTIAAKSSGGFAEWYAVHIYPALQGSIGRLCGLLPFSVAEILCILLPILIIIDIVRSALIAGPAKRILLTASILIFLYSSCCGVNYYREPFVDRLQFDSVEFTVDELADFCEHAVSQLSFNPDETLQTGSNEAATADSNNAEYTNYTYPSKTEIATMAVSAMQRLSEDDSDSHFYDTGRLDGYYPRPKMLTFMSRLFSMMGVSGVYSPFTVEANVNGEMEVLELPFTSCHELSHLKGFMNEGEANFIGWLACIGSDEPSFNHSGWIIAWIYAGNSLYKADPERYFEIREKLPDDVIRELDDNSEFWASHENKASEVQDHVNDAYLKSQGQEAGIASYGQLTTLMLMWYSDLS